MANTLNHIHVYIYIYICNPSNISQNLFCFLGGYHIYIYKYITKKEGCPQVQLVTPSRPLALPQRGAQLRIRSPGRNKNRAQACALYRVALLTYAQLGPWRGSIVGGFSEAVRLGKIGQPWVTFLGAIGSVELHPGHMAIFPRGSRHEPNDLRRFLWRT